MMQKFDRYISLGRDCEVGFQIKRALGRQDSSFFNWNYTEVPALISLLDNDFSGILKAENLSIHGDGSLIRDSSHDFFVHHEFDITLFKDAPDFSAKLLRLQEKFSYFIGLFHEITKSPSHVLYILKYDTIQAREVAIAVQSALRRYHGDNPFTLVTLQTVDKAEPDWKLPGIHNRYLRRFAPYNDTEAGYVPSWDAIFLEFPLRATHARNAILLAEQPVDVSVILNLHREGALLRRSLLSLNDAARHATAQGIKCDLVSVLDRHDALTESVLLSADVSAFSGHTIIRTDHGSLGPARNSGVEAATGTCVFTTDGDDLISVNTLANLFRSAQEHGPNSIQVCQMVFAFGAHFHICEYYDSSFVSPLPFLDSHPYVSRIMCHRALFQHLQYRDLRLGRGYAFEDWSFNADALAMGCTIHAVPETIFFYRQRSDGLLRQAAALSTRQIPPSPLFEPQNFLRLGAAGYARWKQFHDYRHAVPECSSARINEPDTFQQIATANRIEPLIDPARILPHDYHHNLSFSKIAIGIAYYEISKIFETAHFEDVFILPFLAVGGGERYLLNIMWALHDRAPNARILVLLGHSGHEHSWAHQLPPNAMLLDLPSLWPDLQDDGIDIITLKLIQACAPGARLHLKSSAYAERFGRKFLPALSENTAIYYRFCDTVEIRRGKAITLSYGFEFAADMVEYLGLLIADTQFMVKEDCRRIGTFVDKWQTLYSCKPTPHAPEETAELARSAGPRIAWAGRLDPQKRPDLLVPIARALSEAYPSAELHIFGTAVLSRFDTAIFAAVPNIRFHGPYKTFDEVAAGRFSALLFTTLFEGIPNVLIEAAAAGIPIIAPDIGGIGELVRDGETGILLPALNDDAAMTKASVAAMIQLLGNSDLRATLAAGATRNLIAQHGKAAHRRRLYEILNLPAIETKPG